MKDINFEKKPYVLLICVIIVVALLFTYQVVFDDTTLANKNCKLTLKGYLQCDDNEDITSKIVRVSADEVFNGGVSLDEIPSIDFPLFDFDTNFDMDNLVVGVEINGEAKAYPYNILNWHEVVNDTLGGVPIVVTYSPLCNTVNVFERVVDENKLMFGVSGLLYNNCTILHDRQTNELWLQPTGVMLSGVANDNKSLKRVQSYTTTVANWKRAYPNTLFLSPNTEYFINPNLYPYGNYLESDILLFSSKNQNLLRTLKLGQKEKVHILFLNETEPTFNVYGGVSYVVSEDDVRKVGTIDFVLEEKDYSAKWDLTLETVRFYDSSGIELPGVSAFGFVYPALFQ